MNEGCIHPSFGTHVFLVNCRRCRRYPHCLDTVHIKKITPSFRHWHIDINRAYFAVPRRDARGVLIDVSSPPATQTNTSADVTQPTTMRTLHPARSSAMRSPMTNHAVHVSYRRPAPQRASPPKAVPGPDYSGVQRNLALELVRVTEAAALAAGRWFGKGDKEAADDAAVQAMRKVLNSCSMDGVVVIGEGEKDEAPMLYIGERLGDGSPNAPAVDVAVDPLDGTTLISQGRNGAICVIAVAERGTLFDPGACVYMVRGDGSFVTWHTHAWHFSCLSRHVLGIFPASVDTCLALFLPQ